jgi:hypothetical protein
VETLLGIGDFSRADDVPERDWLGLGINTTPPSEELRHEQQTPGSTDLTPLARRFRLLLRRTMRRNVSGLEVRTSEGDDSEAFGLFGFD